MRTALAWNGGIGSVLSLDLLQGDEVTLLHVASPRGLAVEVVERQAAFLGLPLTLAREGGPENRALAAALGALRPERVAFGYLRGEEYEQFHLWKALASARVPAVLPVRHIPAPEAARQVVASGHRVVIREAAPPFDARLVGRTLDEGLVDEIDALGGRRGWAAIRTSLVP